MTAARKQQWLVPFVDQTPSSLVLFQPEARNLYAFLALLKYLNQSINLNVGILKIKHLSRNTCLLTINLPIARTFYM